MKFLTPEQIETRVRKDWVRQLLAHGEAYAKFRETLCTDWTDPDHDCEVVVVVIVVVVVTSSSSSLSSSYHFLLER